MYDKNLCRAVQLNASWPPVNQVEKIIKNFPEMMITLQIPKSAMEGLSIEEIAKSAGDYEDMITWALIDPSGGLGVDFDLNKSIDLMNSLRRRMSDAIIGVAGGFYHGNVEERVRKIESKHPYKFCIDAEGKLMENHTLVIDKAKKYIDNAATALLYRWTGNEARKKNCRD